MQLCNLGHLKPRTFSEKKRSEQLAVQFARKEISVMASSFQVHLSKKFEIEQALKSATIKNLKQGRKEKEEQRTQIQQKQINLTENISNAYTAIRPTIIQAQRLLKILDRLQGNIEMTMFLNFEFLAHFVDELSLASSNLLPKIQQLEIYPKTMKYLGEISRIQQEIFLLKNQDYKSVYEVDEEEEEEESFRRDDDDISQKEASEENEEDRQAKELRKEKVLQFREEMSVKYRNFIRYLRKNPKEFAKIKALHGGQDEDIHYHASLNSMTSIKMIYLKKLSTGYDEDQQHKKQLEELLQKIEKFKQNKIKKTEELTQLRDQKEKYRIEQNEIKAKLERDLIGVQEKKDATKKRLDEECEKELALEQKNHEEHKAKLEQLLSEEVKSLNDAETKNIKAQDQEINKKNNLVQTLKNKIEQYDTAMDTKVKDLADSRMEFDTIKQKLDQIENEYRIILHEQQVNKAIRDEWDSKVKKFTIHEERKKASANFLFLMWQSWKNKKGKKKKCKKKAK